MSPTTTAQRLDDDALNRLFVEPRTRYAWSDAPVPDALLESAWQLARNAPTSANCQPLRLVVLRTAEEKARLLPFLDRSNRTKSETAAVVLLMAYDVEFWRELKRLFPHADAAAWFKGDPVKARETALRNGSLQAAWLMMALRGLGLDVGPMSGFDAAGVNAAFFAGTTVEVNFVCNVGVGADDLRPRLPRLTLEELAPAAAREDPSTLSTE